MNATSLSVALAPFNALKHTLLQAYVNSGLSVRAIRSRGDHVVDSGDRLDGGWSERGEALLRLG